VNTYAIEAMMQDKKALQAGTSHFLGQNFARAFDVTFQTAEGGLDHVWASSWGVSTRLIGALIMAHSDDNGLVLPPKLAPQQIVLVPIFKNKNKTEVLGYADRVHEQLRGSYRCAFDADEQNSPGWRFTEWEMRGVPLRVEIGPRDMENEQVMVARRDTGEKTPVPFSEVHEKVGELLEQIQKDLFAKARAFRDENTHRVEDYEEFTRIMAEEGGFVIAPWCGSPESEARVKEDSKATIRVLPFGNENEAKGKKCFVTGEPAQYMAVFARSY
jgi:prolyl-tRNA synthetase